MFTRPTVFIIGAGASAPFGFPTGNGLLQVITGANPLKPTEDSVEVFAKHKLLVEILKHEIDPSLVNGLVKRLGDAMPPSIDTWLSDNADYMSTGREAIATIICDCESYVRRHPTEQDDWYKWVYHRMLAGCRTPEELAKNPVSFITFNYDRMLEYTLGNAIFNHFGRVNANARVKVIEEIYSKIIHVHGVLSFEDFEGLRNSFGSICFDGMKDHIAESRKVQIEKIASQARALARGIRIIGEVGVNQYPENDIANALNAAGRIVFLGFGFDERNLAIMRLKNKVQELAAQPDANLPVLGTAYGLRKAQVRDVEDYFDHQIFLDTKFSCKAFCDEYLSKK